MEIRAEFNPDGEAPAAHLDELRFVMLRAAEAKEEQQEPRELDAAAFARLTLPPIGATLEEMDTYRRAALAVGAPITANDIVSFVRGIERDARAADTVERAVGVADTVERAVVGSAVDRSEDGPAMRTMPPWDNSVDRRFAQLQVAQDAPRPAGRLLRTMAKVGTKPFEQIPLPPVGSGLEPLDAYCKAARLSGTKISADDLRTFERMATDLQLTHSGLTVDEDLRLAISDPETPVNVRAMLVALAGQTEARELIVAARAEYERRTNIDRIESLKPARFTPEMSAENVTRDEQAFAQKRDRLAALPPLPPNAPFETYERYRLAMRDVGIPFEPSDYLLYRAAIRADRDGSALPLSGEVPMELMLASGKIAVPLSLTALDELRRPRDERRLLAAEPAQFAAILRERLPALNAHNVRVEPGVVIEYDDRADETPQPAPINVGGSATSVVEGPHGMESAEALANDEAEINELPIFYDLAPNAKRSAPPSVASVEDTRFADLAQAARRDGFLVPNPFAKPFEKLRVPAPDATLRELNDYRRAANRGGVRITAADLQTYATLSASHGSESYPRLMVKLAEDNAFAEATIPDARTRRHVVKIAAALCNQHPEYSRDYAFESQLALTVNDRGVNRKGVVDLVGSRMNLLGRSLAGLETIEPLPASPTNAEVAYYGLALGAVGIPLSGADVRDYRQALMDGGVANLAQHVAGGASPGLRALADLHKSPGQRAIFNGSTAPEYLKTLDALLAPKNRAPLLVDSVQTDRASEHPVTDLPSQQNVPDAQKFGRIAAPKNGASSRATMSGPVVSATIPPLPYRRTVDGKTVEQLAAPFFKSEGPVRYDKANGTLSQRYGPGTNEFRLSDVVGRLQPGGDRDKLVKLIENNRDIRFQNTPSGLQFTERTKRIEPKSLHLSGRP